MKNRVRYLAWLDLPAMIKSKQSSKPKRIGVFIDTFTARAVVWIVKAALCAGAVAGEVALANSEFIDDAILELGFKSSRKADLESGAIISVGLPFIERHPNELTVGAAMMLVRWPLEEATEALISDATFCFNTDIFDFRALGNGSASRAQIDAGFHRCRIP